MKIEGEVHHKPRYERYPRLMGVGVLPQPDEESERIFTTLVSRNAINLHALAHERSPFVVALPGKPVSSGQEASPWVGEKP